MTPRTPEPAPDIVENIEDIDVSSEMQGSFLEYAYSVIYSRALPDARDGLKPVQRRIIYQMSVMGLRPDRGHVKSARVVGDVMGKLHPHGDASIYDALVRLAQSWTLRLPLVDGHGNFGSLDDGPAASRYTEARPAPAALSMTDGLDEDVVDFIPNYDNTEVQPDVLPAAYPNLLVNGASGIAVGMATNMAPHNLIEVVAGARYLITHPAATVDDLMQFIPGPDLPGGGTIVGLAGIRDAYATGRGAFKTRAKVSIETLTARKVGLVVTELPYLVGAEKVISKIKDGVNSKKLQGISDVTDLTDRTNGLRLVIGIKTGFSPEAVLEQLYRQTPLEDSFNINNVALVNGSPQTLGLKQLLQVYVDHRIEVTTRRTQFRLRKRRERLHLLLGLLIAILDIDEVIQVIRNSDDTEQARTRLIDVFDLDQLQADYILELRLRRLTRFSRIELETERDQLLKEIEHLEALLANKALIRQTVSEELDEVADALGTPRRTLLTEARAAAPTTAAARREQVSLELADTPCRVFLSTTGRTIRVDLPTPAEIVSGGGDSDGGADSPADGSVPGRSPRPTGAHTRRSKHDAVLSVVETTTRTEIGAVTSLGRLLRMSVQDLPVAPANSVQLGAGVRIADYLAVDTKREQIIALVSLSSDVPIALGTKLGTVKRIIPSDWPNKPDFELIALKPGDEVVGATQPTESSNLVFVASDAQLLHFPAAAVRPQGRTAGGMAGISLGAGATVIAFSAVAPGAIAPDATTQPVEGELAEASATRIVVATVASSSGMLPGTDSGSAKVSEFSEFPPKGRATGGVRAHRFLRGEDALQLAWVGPEPALAVASDGAVRTLPEPGAKRDASGTPLAAPVASIGFAATLP
ncbi:DNA gyrase/topoisomerase IV subunit A [Subtercola boreus]|uniref:DNA topoisomerase (ATP-hydrolyzing) n=1 Tax=Subtercola boreus TaxID=120213 RepID=A0A3E0WD89_9MICO|nr:DNA topoisomerase IV subunit A [Subtercola boreus]RFA20759.1 DNA topoisomerase IV [Subtercola boreus]RFA20874.1 DNA topoisomerase IV [Subtercola boreus]RFA27067.1 DNA topoisomerase IV [Subtercola boreus]